MSAYSDAIMATTGLICYYRMNESSGTAMVDATGITGNATYSGSGVTLGQASIVPQDSDTCVRFDGTNNNASRAHVAALALTSQITVIGWIYPELTKAQSLVFKWDHFFLSVMSSATPSVRWYLFGLADGLMFSPSNTIVAGGTYMIAGTFDGTHQKIYINGVEVKSVTHPGGSTFSSSTQALEIGSNGGFFGGGKVQGRMAHLSIFNVGLTKAQIENLYLLGIEAASTTSSTVHSFSKQIIAANSSRTHLTITNNSDATVWLRLGATAVVGQGIRLNGLGGVWQTETYQGAVFAIHDSVLGTRTVTMEETS